MGMIKEELSEALFSKTQRGVLGLLFGNPDRSFYANEIMRHVRAGIGAVQRELERLVSAGLLTVSRVGNQKHYQASRQSPIFDEIVAIVSKTMNAEASAQGLAARESRASYAVGRRAQAFHVPRGRLAAICRRHRVKRLGVFGSAARGDATESSDVDLLVEFEPGKAPGLLGLAGIEAELSALLGGRPVDLRTAQDLSRHFRDEVARSAEVQYAG